MRLLPSCAPLMRANLFCLSCQVSGENTRLESGVVFLLAAGVDADISAEEEQPTLCSTCLRGS